MNPINILTPIDPAIKYRVEIVTTVNGTPRFRCVRVTIDPRRALDTQDAYQGLGYYTRIQAKAVRGA